MINGIHKYKKTIEKLQELGVELFDVRSYCGDEQELLCVINKKELRQYLRPILLQLWRLRQYLRTERKYLNLGFCDIYSSQFFLSNSNFCCAFLLGSNSLKCKTILVLLCNIFPNCSFILFKILIGLPATLFES